MFFTGQDRRYRAVQNHLAKVRLYAATIAVICFLGQVTSLAHFWLVQHVVCAEHGELIHSSEVAHAQPAAHELVDEGPADSIQAGTEDSNPVDDNHDHCLAVSERRKSCIVARTTWNIPPPPLAGAADSIVEGPPRVASLVPYLLLAPKTSPPA